MSPEDTHDDDGKPFRRNYKACLNCRTRKVRCDLGPLDAPHDPPCARCKRERKECVFAESRRGGIPPAKKRKHDERSKSQTPTPVAAPHFKAQTELFSSTAAPASSSQATQPVPGNILPLPYTSRSVTSAPDQHSLQNYQQQRQAPVHTLPERGSTSGSGAPLPPIASSLNRVFSERANSNVTQSSDEMSSVPPPRSELTTMQGALVFLARAAGTIARADDRDNINGREMHEQFESSEESRRTSKSQTVGDDFVPLKEDKTNLLSMPPLDKASKVRPSPSKSLADIDYIGEDKLLTEAEAEHLIHLFFLTMHPFFPHIPEQLHSPKTLAGYPILLCAILTIASRYHPFEANIDKSQINKNSRNIQLHERLWIYCQRLISQTVWAEASTRSVGTVLAFLLFTEWNPRAIHWRWSDYANGKDASQDSDSEAVGAEEGEEGLAGLSAMRRSDRMAWMLVGTSVRLAQDMGFINGSSKIFVATHIAETHTAMNLGQRSMLAQSLSEVDLDNDDEGEVVDNRKQFLHDEFILSLDEETMRQRSLQKKSLKFSFVHKAKLELLKVMSLAYETVYCGQNQLDPTQHKQNLTILGVLSPLIENWYKTYRKLLKPSNPKNFNHHCNLNMANNPKHVQEVTRQIDKESLICDYYYCQLYIYSLALSMENPVNTNSVDSKKPLNNIRLDEITKAAKYIELAYNAAKEILNSTVRVHKLKMLKYMPVRWVVRIVRSVAFIVKCFLTLTNNSAKQQSGEAQARQTSTLLTLSILPTDDILQTIQKAAIVLREASPDELHLCTRYSTILMYLCSEMKYRSKFTANPPKVTPLDVSDEEDEINYEQAYNHPGQPGDVSNPTSHEAAPPYPPIPPSASGTEGMYFGYQQMKDAQPLPDAVVDWFMKNDETIGLDFVEPWTEMIEQHLDKQKN